MNAPTSPLPASLQRAEAEVGDLDARILRAEQRLIAREENMHRRLAAVGLRVQRTLKPGRLWLPLGASLAMGVLGWLWRGRRAAPVPQGPAAVMPAAGSPEDQGVLRWLRLAGVLWPLLPAAWRQRVSPVTFNLVLGVGVRLAELLRPRHPPPPDGR